MFRLVIVNCVFVLYLQSVDDIGSVYFIQYLHILILNNYMAT